MYHNSQDRTSNNLSTPLVRGRPSSTSTSMGVTSLEAKGLKKCLTNQINKKLKNTHKRISRQLPTLLLLVALDATVVLFLVRVHLDFIHVNQKSKNFLENVFLVLGPKKVNN